jgi:hypothetical protein
VRLAVSAGAQWTSGLREIGFCRILAAKAGCDCLRVKGEQRRSERLSKAGARWVRASCMHLSLDLQQSFVGLRGSAATGRWQDATSDLNGNDMLRRLEAIDTVMPDGVCPMEVRFALRCAIEHAQMATAVRTQRGQAIIGWGCNLDEGAMGLAELHTPAAPSTPRDSKALG